MTPELVYLLVAGVGGFVVRHYFPKLAGILPTTPAVPTLPTLPASPVVPATPAAPASDALTAVLHWLTTAVVAKATTGYKLTDADLAAIKAILATIASLDVTPATPGK